MQWPTTWRCPRRPRNPGASSPSSPSRLIARAERQRALETAGYNVFRLRSEDVFVDLLTDSGTSAMSVEQWASLQRGDEAYAGARNWTSLETVLQRITGYGFVIPTHQGRGAETVYTRAFVEPGQFVIGNMHFDTTRAHIYNRGAWPVNLVVDAGLDASDPSQFKGDLDVDKAERFIAEKGVANVPLCILTITCNTNGGQPVSIDNARRVSELCRRHGIRLIIDAARFAENAYLVKEREPGMSTASIEDIAHTFFSMADGAAMSAKKDALVNIGGWLAFAKEDDYVEARKWAVLYEGFLTYGGMAGRDLEAMATGLVEGMDEAYLAARIRQVRLLHGWLVDAGIPVIVPPGGHSVMIDCARFLEHLPRERYQAESLAAALYLDAGVRSVGLGGLAFAEIDPETGAVTMPPWEYVRLAVPRRVYSDNHLAYVAEALAGLYAKREEIPGLKLLDAPMDLPHFTAKFAPA